MMVEWVFEGKKLFRIKTLVKNPSTFIKSLKNEAKIINKMVQASTKVLSFRQSAK